MAKHLDKPSIITQNKDALAYEMLIARLTNGQRIDPALYAPAYRPVAPGQYAPASTMPLVWN